MKKITRRIKAKNDEYKCNPVESEGFERLKENENLKRKESQAMRKIIYIFSFFSVYFFLYRE